MDEQKDDIENVRKTVLDRLQKALSWDPESAHYEGDAMLCLMLRTLGYGDVVAAWDKLDKWYA